MADCEVTMEAALRQDGSGGIGLGVAAAAVTAGWCVLAVTAWRAGSELPGAAAGQLLCMPPGSLTPGDLGRGFAGWAAMTAAMMLPCAHPAWRALMQGAAAAGLAALAGFATVWLVLGAVLVGLVATFAALTGTGGPAAIPAAWLWAAAAVALLHRLARRCPPEAAAEIAASSRRGAFAAGCGEARRCLALDAPPMVLCMLAGGGSLAAMAAATMLMLAERRTGGWTRRIAGAAALVVLLVPTLPA